MPILALLMLWCVTRVIYTLLRIVMDQIDIEEMVLMIALAFGVPLLLVAVLRVPTFFVYAHANLPLELIFLTDALTSLALGVPMILIGLVPTLLLGWALMASAVTIFRYRARQEKGRPR